MAAKKPISKSQMRKWKKQGKASKRKGKVGERLWRNQLIDAGCTSARRSVQYNGKDAEESDSDLVVKELSVFHHEVKFVENLNVYKAMATAIAEAKPGKIPYIAHKRSNSEFLVYMRGEDWIKLALAYENQTRNGSRDPGRRAANQAAAPSPGASPSITRDNAGNSGDDSTLKRILRR